jgi:hypothetical protein
MSHLLIYHNGPALSLVSYGCIALTKALPGEPGVTWIQAGVRVWSTLGPDIPPVTTQQPLKIRIIQQIRQLMVN